MLLSHLSIKGVCVSLLSTQKLCATVSFISAHFWRSVDLGVRPIAYTEAVWQCVLHVLSYTHLREFTRV